jgi:hypothetical protein
MWTLQTPLRNDSPLRVVQEHTCGAGADVSDSAATAGQGEDQRGTGIRLHKTSVARLGAVIGLQLCVLERMSLGMSWDGRAALVVLFCSVNYTSLRRPRWVTVSCELDVLSRRPNMGASPQQIYAFPHWQPAYHGCAGRNGPPQAVCTRTSCRKSIFESLQEIADSPVHQVERQAIFDADGTLAFLKRDAQKP